MALPSGILALTEKLCSVLEAAAGSWLWELTAVSLLQLGSSREALLLECGCMPTVLPHTVARACM